MTASRADIAQFVKERNAALLSLDETCIRDYAKKYGAEVSDNPLVFWASVHKARLAVTEFGEDVKQVSRKWLRDRGFKDVSIFEGHDKS
jgi:hypothetical protein